MKTTVLSLERITKKDDERALKFVALYESAFPAGERRHTRDFLSLIETNPDYRFNAVTINGKTAGMAVYWDLKDFYYLEYFAMFPGIRNKGIGQMVMEYINKTLSGIKLFEVEPAVDERTSRRIKFYERNGYRVLDKNNTVLFKARNNGCHLWIMGNTNPALLERYILTIRDTVYK